MKKVSKKVLKVKKRSGEIEKFERKKLESSLRKAMVQADYRNWETAGEVIEEVKANLKKRYSDKPVPVENIKHIVHKTLKKKKLWEVAKHYLLFRYM